MTRHYNCISIPQTLQVITGFYTKFQLKRMFILLLVTYSDLGVDHFWQGTLVFGECLIKLVSDDCSQ